MFLSVLHRLRSATVMPAVAGVDLVLFERPLAAVRAELVVGVETTGTWGVGADFAWHGFLGSGKANRVRIRWSVRQVYGAMSGRDSYRRASQVALAGERDAACSEMAILSHGAL